MSRGQHRLRSHSTRKILKRCQNRGNTEEAIIIDDDNENADVVFINVINSRLRSKNEKTRLNSPSGVIYIDDVEEDSRSSSSDLENNHFAETFSHFSLSEDSESEESVKLVGSGNVSCDHPSPSRNCYGLDFDLDSSMTHSPESNTDECDEFAGSNSDCEIIEDHSGIIREQWEKAASMKKETCQFTSLDQAKAFNSTVYPEDSSHGPTLHDADTGNFFEGMPSNHFEEIHAAYGIRSSNNNEQSSSANVPFTDENNIFGFKTTVNTQYRSNCPISREDVGNYTKNDASNIGKSLQTANLMDNDLSFVNMNAQESAKVSFFTSESLGKPWFFDKEELFTRIFFDPPSSDGKQVSKDNVICPNQSESILDEALYNAQSKHEMVADQEASNFTESEKRASEESPPFCSRQQEDLLTKTVDSTFCGNVDAKWDKLDAKFETSVVGLTSHKPDDMLHCDEGLIGVRERHKETDEYKRVVEEEWESRRRQLQIQAEEAQRLRKRRKAENMRLIDMEIRQKQRLEEVRDLQKKDEEIMQLKEQIRSEVRKDLEKVEMNCRDMASVLRALGIHVNGGLFPMMHEINAAYKQALLRFHPDRASRTDIRQQVECEEKFKLIARLKEKLLL